MKKKGPIDLSTHTLIFSLSFYFFSFGLSFWRVVFRMEDGSTSTAHLCNEAFQRLCNRKKEDGLKASDHVPPTNYTSASLCQVNENQDPHCLAQEKKIRITNLKKNARTC